MNNSNHSHIVVDNSSIDQIENFAINHRDDEQQQVHCRFNDTPNSISDYFGCHRAGLWRLSMLIAVFLATFCGCKYSNFYMLNFD